MDRATEFIAGQIIEDLVQQDNHPLQRKKALMEEYETSLIKLGLEFLDAAKNCDSDKLQEFIDADFPVNFQSPDLQESALHIVAAKGCYDSVKVLAGSGKCDYLLKDIYSRTAFSNSIFYADPEDAVDVVDLLEAETKAAAADAGIDLWESVRESRETFARHKHDLS